MARPGGVPKAGPVTLVRTPRRLLLGLLAGSLAATSLLDAGAPGAHAERPAERVVARDVDPVLSIVGPTVSTLGRTVHLVAVGRITESGAPTYSWDLDGDGRHERSTGTTGSVDFGFTRAGQRSVGVLVQVPGASSTATLAVRVRRPSSAAIQVSPPYAGPGDTVRLTMATRSDAGSFRAFTWRVEGVKPTRTAAGLRTGAPTGGRAAASPFAGADVDLTTAGTNLAVTTKPVLEVRLPKSPKKQGTTIDIVGQALAPDGSIVVATRRLKLDDRLRGLAPKPYPEGQVVDCQKMPPGVPSYPCAQVTASGDFATGIPVVFTNSTPSVQGCMPYKEFQAGGAPVVNVQLKEKQNLGYPAPEAFTLDGFNTKAQAVGGRSDRSGRVAGRAAPQEKCTEVAGKTISWSWGDGTSSDEGYDWMGHTYAEPGTYTVTMTTTVPYFKVKGQKMLTQVLFFKAKTSIKVTIREGFCGPVSLNGFVARARDYKTFGCYVPFTSADGSRTLYRPQEGYGIDVAGLSVQGVDWVDPGAATVVGGPKGLTARMTGRTPGTSGQVFKTVLAAAPSLVLPPPTYDATLGAEVTALPPAPTTPGSFFRAVRGLKVASAQAFVSPSAPPRVVLALDLPDPLGDNTPPVVEQGEYLLASSGAGRSAPTARRDVPPGTDFSVDLTDTDLGAFRITRGGIHHRTAGGWIGDLAVDVDGLGELNAPYRPVPTTPGSTDCETIDGPSGLEIDGNGSFVSGGAQALFAPPITIGPLGLDCVAVRGSSSPFVLEGRAGLSLPAGTSLITIDACLAASVLKGGQTASGCGKSFTAPEDSVWFRAAGQARLLDFLTLSTASFEAQVSKNYQSAVLEGGVSYDAGAFRLSGSVRGTIVAAPTKAFDLIGTVSLCQVNFIKDVCFDVQGGVSSRGFGACASLGGFVYYWDSGLDFFFASCDLRAKIGVQRGIARRAAGTISDTPVPAGLRKVAFVVHRAEPGRGAPTVRLDVPGGGSITDDGRPVQEGRGYTIAKFPDQGVTSVTVDRPRAGTWEVVGLDGAIRTELHTPVAEPVVTGAVGSRGSVRTLSYDATLAPGDSLVLTETGRSGTRVIARTTDRDASVRIGRAGTAGKRFVRAIVIRNGVPYTTITLGTYVAPAGARLAAPTTVTATPVGTGLRVTWPAVAGARGYDVQARTSTGRILTQRVSGLSAVLSGLGRIAAGSVSVTAVGVAGTTSPRRTVALRPVTSVRMRL